MSNYASPERLPEMLAPIRAELQQLRSYADSVEYQRAVLLDAAGQYPIEPDVEGRVAFLSTWHDDRVEGTGVAGERLVLQMLLPDATLPTAGGRRTTIACLEQDLHGDWLARLDKEHRVHQLAGLYHIAEHDRALPGVRQLAKTILGAYGQGDHYLQDRNAPTQAFTDVSFRQLWQRTQEDLDAAGVPTFFRYDYSGNTGDTEVRIRAMDTLPQTHGSGVVTGLVRAVTTIRSPAFQFSHIRRGNDHQARFIPNEPLPADLPGDPEIMPPPISAQGLTGPQDPSQLFELFLPDLLDPADGSIIRTPSWNDAVRQRDEWVRSQQAANLGLFELNEARAAEVTIQLKRLSVLALQGQFAL